MKVIPCPPISAWVLGIAASSVADWSSVRMKTTLSPGAPSASLSPASATASDPASASTAAASAAGRRAREIVLSVESARICRGC